MSGPAPRALGTTLDRPLTDDEAAALDEVYRHPAQPQRAAAALLEALARAGLVTLECRSRLGLVFICGRVTATGRVTVEATCPAGRPVISLGPDIYFHAANQLVGQPVAAFYQGRLGTIRLVSRESELWIGYDRAGTPLTDAVPHDVATLAVYDAARPELVTQLTPSGP